MTDKYQNKYRISSSRLQNWDYGWNSPYFVTICTQNRVCYFGDIIDSKIQLSEIGKMAQKYWWEIPAHFPFVKLGAFVVMPNHVHGIIVIDKTDDGRHVETRQCLVSTSKTTTNKPTIGQKRFKNQGKNTLSSIIGSYKSVVTKNAHNIHSDFAWQSRFHDHIIRTSKSFDRIEKYINENPIKWEVDKFYNQPK